MEQSIQQLLEALLQAGIPGIVLALVVLVAVFLLKRGGVVVTSNMARLANVILAVILSGLDPAHPETGQALIAAIASIVSALIYELLKLLQKKPTPLNRTGGYYVHQRQSQR